MLFMASSIQNLFTSWGIKNMRQDLNLQSSECHVELHYVEFTSYFQFGVNWKELE